MGETISASPLTWPNGWPRTETRARQRARFSKRDSNGRLWEISIAQAVQFTTDQLRMMGVNDEDVVVSTNLKLRLDGLPYSDRKAQKEAHPDHGGSVERFQAVREAGRMLGL